MSKSQIRKTIKNKIWQLSEKQIKNYSESISAQFKVYYSNFDTFFVYLSKSDEVQTAEIIKFLRDNKKIVLVPKVFSDGVMVAVEYTHQMIMEKNHWWVLEPKTSKIYDKSIDVALVPGLAFSLDGKRLGRWGGYYDRFLTQNPDIFKLWVCFPEQIVETLPVYDWDVVMDKVIVGF